jgi:hypothetical protein
MKKQKNLVLETGLIILITCFLFSCEKNEIEIKKSDYSNNSAITSFKSSGFDNEIAKRWAPVHRQDVDATGSHGLSGRADYITAINFDGDWVATNNWDNIANSAYSPTAHCYYSVTETSTNWFILYSFFHPRDWTDNILLYGIDEHENDLEGVLIVIKKDGSTYGSIQAAVTVYHSDFYSYLLAEASYQENYESVDGTLQMQWYNDEWHPITSQECRGHGIKAHPYVDIDGDGIVYYPSMDDIAEAPESNYDTDVKYKLVDVFESGGLWDQRNNSQLFSGGSFLSSYGSGSANAPWNWEDDDDDIQRGHIATYPAGLVAEYFKNLGTYSFLYTTNGYSGNVLNEGAYKVVAKHSNKMIDVYNWSTANGGNIAQWEDNGGGSNQIWRVYGVGDNYYKLESKHSGKVLDVYDFSTDNGGNIVQWDYWGNSNQQWSFSEAENGYYVITNRNSGKVIDVEGASTANGANIHQWTYYGYDWQKFKLEWFSAVNY